MESALRSQLLFTRSDYDALPEGLRVEVIGGELLKMEPPTIRHQKIASRVFAEHWQHWRSRAALVLGCSYLTVAGFCVVGKRGRAWAKAPVRDVERLAFTGVHVIDPAIFRRMTETGVFPITQTYLRLAGEGERIVACRVDGSYWQDIGSPENLARARRRAAGAD